MSVIVDSVLMLPEFLRHVLDALSISDWISVVGAVASLALAGYIARVQYKQSAKMADMEKRIDERDERRHMESVDAQSADFIVTYGFDRGFIPLCAIAAMNDDSFLYSRKIYRAFNVLPREVQNRILERCGMDLRVHTVPDFLDQAVDFVVKLVNDEFPGDRTPFYENAKYIRRSLEKHRDERVLDFFEYAPANEVPGRSYCARRSYERDIVDALRKVFIERGSHAGVINRLMDDYSFSDHEQTEAEACQFATTLAHQLIAFSKDPDKSKNFGDISDALASDERTLEDLFYCSCTRITFVMWHRRIAE